MNFQASSVGYKGLTGPSVILPDCLSLIHSVQQTLTTQQLPFVSSENIPREAGCGFLATTIRNSQCSVRAKGKEIRTWKLPSDGGEGVRKGTVRARRKLNS